MSENNMLKKSNLSTSNLNNHNNSMNIDNSGSPNIKQFVQSQESFIDNLQKKTITAQGSVNGSEAGPVTKNSVSGSVNGSEAGPVTKNSVSGSVHGSVSGSVHGSIIDSKTVDTIPSNIQEQTGGVEDENNFILFQEQLKTDVKEYMELDDQIKSLNKAVAQRRKTKSKLADSILNTMKKFEIENMNTKNGRLIYSVKKSFKGLNKKNLLTGLNIYFKDEDKAKDATTAVLSNREVIEKVSLKRSNNKKNPLNI
jgi:hypothetical protein